MKESSNKSSSSHSAHVINLLIPLQVLRWIRYVDHSMSLFTRNKSVLKRCGSN